MARTKAPAADQAQTNEEAPAADQAQGLVRMVRGDDHSAPHEADVHPDEVANYAAGGWVAAE